MLKPRPTPTEGTWEAMQTRLGMEESEGGTQLAYDTTVPRTNAVGEKST